MLKAADVLLRADHNRVSHIYQGVSDDAFKLRVQCAIGDPLPPCIRVEAITKLRDCNMMFQDV